MNGWTLAGFLLGWIFGVAQSYRRILKERRGKEIAARNVGQRLYEMLKDADVINITVTEEDERELKIDQDKLDQLLGNKPTKH